MAARSGSGGAFAEDVLTFERSCMKGIVGLGGANLKQVRSESEATVNVSPEGDLLDVRIEGTPEQRALARQLLVAYAGQEPLGAEAEDSGEVEAEQHSDEAYADPPEADEQADAEEAAEYHDGGQGRDSDEQRVVLDFEQRFFATIIGQAGATLRSLRSTSGADVQVKSVREDGVVRVTITGTTGQVQDAETAVRYLVADAGHPAAPSARPSAALGGGGAPAAPAAPALTPLGCAGAGVPAPSAFGRGGPRPARPPGAAAALALGAALRARPPAQAPAATSPMLVPGRPHPAAGSAPPTAKLVPAAPTSAKPAPPTAKPASLAANLAPQDAWKGVGKGALKGKGKGGKPACTFFLQGRCTRGATCAFSHEVWPDQDGDPDWHESAPDADKAPPAFVPAPPTAKPASPAFVPAPPTAKPASAALAPAPPASKPAPPAQPPPGVCAARPAVPPAAPPPGMVPRQPAAPPGAPARPQGWRPLAPPAPPPARAALAGAEPGAAGAAGGAEAEEGEGGGGHWDAEDEVTLTVSGKEARKVVGQSGATVKKIRSESGASITMGNLASETCPICITGTADAVDRARAIVGDVLARAEKVTAQTLVLDDELFVQVPQSDIGRFIGKGGANIKRIQEASWAKVQVLKDQGDPRLVYIHGNYEAVELAWTMAKASVSGSGPKEKDGWSGKSDQWDHKASDGGGTWKDSWEGPEKKRKSFSSEGWHDWPEKRARTSEWK